MSDHPNRPGVTTGAVTVPCCGGVTTSAVNGSPSSSSHCAATTPATPRAISAALQPQLPPKLSDTGTISNLFVDVLASSPTDVTEKGSRAVLSSTGTYVASTQRSTPQ